MSTRIKTLFVERIDIQQLIEDITVSVYDKHFSADELRDLVAFYKSPTGRKVMEVTPVMLSESATKASELVAPKGHGGSSKKFRRKKPSSSPHDIQELLKSAPKPATKPATRSSSRRP